MIDIKKGKYWDRPWQLTSGCSPCSPGCLHCWSAAAAYMRQFQKNPKISGQYEGLTYLRNGIPTFNGTCRFNIERLEMPLRTKKHTVWAVWNDLFHEDVLFFNQLSTWIIMRDSKRQFFLVLTKRPDKMLYFYHRLQSGGYPIVDKIWNGLTVCTQREADEKGPISLQIPGNKFWSLEPLLEKIDIIPALLGFGSDKPYSGKLGGVIIGPETGPHRRPCNLEWVENIVADCEYTGIPVFVKALNLNGKISTDMAEWPADLRVRQLPWLKY